ncbi:MAG: hypothetical protein NZM00_09155 [Anaerolinea sp.]|nr:hypothetical protein [Anaerolinea sp.]
MKIAIHLLMMRPPLLIWSASAVWLRPRSQMMWWLSMNGATAPVMQNSGMSVFRIIRPELKLKNPIGIRC